MFNIINEKKLHREPEFKFQFCSQTKYKDFWYFKHIVTDQILSHNNMKGNLIPCIFTNNLEAEIFLYHNPYGIRASTSMLCYEKEEVIFPSGVYWVILQQHT